MRMALYATLALALGASLYGESTRTVTGTVTDHRGNPLPGSVVQIEDNVTLEIQSFIVHADGQFHFANLNPNVEYTVHATYRGHNSKPAVISRFDGKPVSKLTLVIPVE